MAKTTKPPKATNVTASGVDLAEVERLLEFMQKHNLEEFEYEREGVHVLLKKTSARQHSGQRPMMYEEPVHYQAAAPPPAPSAPLAAPPEQKAAAENFHEVKSPIVGTFYASPSPEAEQFVRVGDHVEAGQVLCIIEAMKLMNEIESDVAGEITKIFMENGHPVEYGEPLFGIRPGRKK